jgi:tetratricopeptide (TPR) repeat protein
LYRFAFPAILAIALALANPLAAASADLGQLDASPTLFTVMAAINAAGFDAEANSPSNHPIRAAIREEIAKRNPPSLAAIKEFVAKHRLSNEINDFSQYVSFGLTIGPPPAFALTKRDVDIPPDAAGLQDLAPLLAAFYKEANIDDLRKRSQRAIDQYVERYHTPVSEAVLQATVYLRQQTSGARGRHFQIFVELQGPPNQVQRRSYGEQDFVVVTPSAEPRIFDIRHAYLHYLIDPLSSHAAEIIERKKALVDHAMRARILPESYKEDFMSLTTESMIKAVEARLDKKPEAVQEALRQGFILTPYFSEQLPVYEKQEQAMLLYYKEMVSAIDLVREDARLSQTQFDTAAAPRTVKAPVPAPAPPPALSGAAKTLNAAEQQYKAKDYDKAKSLFLAVLEQTDQRPVHAAAYYGLARIAVFQKDPETGERLFLKVLELDPEPFVKSWTLVFLGRLSLSAGEKDQAAKYFQSALSVEGGTDESRKAAQQGVQQTQQ